MSTIKKYLCFVLFGMALFGCNKKYDTKNYYSQEELKSNLSSILPYISKLENGVNFDNRFEPKNKEYFEMQQQNFKFSIEQYYIAPDSLHYFLIWKIAPSRFEKKIAIGGRFRKDKNGKIYSFEELFNTPKMEIVELKEKSFQLFDYMVQNGNVDKFIGDYLLIEFPDKHCVYDKAKSKWVVIDPFKSNDSLKTN